MHSCVACKDNNKNEDENHTVCEWNTTNKSRRRTRPIKAVGARPATELEASAHTSRVIPYAANLSVVGPDEDAQGTSIGTLLGCRNADRTIVKDYYELEDDNEQPRPGIQLI